MKYRLKAKHYLWILPPLLVFIIAELIRGQLSVNGNIFGDFKPPKDYKAKEAQNRIFFISSATIFVIMTITLGVFSIVDVYKRLRLQQILFFLPILLVAAIVVYIIMAGQTPLFKDSYEIFGNLKLEDGTPAEFFKTVLNHSHSDLFGNFKNIYLYGAGFLLVAVGFSTFAAVSALAHPEDINQKRDNVKALKRLDNYLLVSGTALAIGIVYYMSWMYWPGFVFIAEENGQESFRKIVRSMTIFTGLTYSLMIAAYYLPVRLHIINAMNFEENQNRLQNKYHSSKRSSLSSGNNSDLITNDPSNEVEVKDNSVLKWIFTRLSLPNETRELISYTVKILSPLIVAYVSTHLNLDGG